MAWVKVTRLAWYHRPALWIGLGVTASLGVLSLPYAERAWHAYNVKRHIKRAEEATARGDYRQAILDDRIALAFDPKNVDALRVMARTIEAGGWPAALEYRRQIEAVRPGDAENLLAMAEDQLKAGAVDAADGALRQLAPADQQSARYHYLASGIALGKKQRAAAENHLSEAVRLEPANESYRLRFAAVQLESGDPAVRTPALEALHALAAKSSQRLPALRVLIQYAKSEGQSAEALALAEKLAGDPKAAFSDRLSRLVALHDAKPSEYGSFSALEARQQFYTLLSQMQEAALNQPTDLYQLIAWMNEHDLALAVTEWADRISPETAARVPVCVSIADAYARASAWTTLRTKVEKASWAQVDFLRLAYLARALERLNDPAGSQQAWNKAVAGAQSTTALETLARDVVDWEWLAHSGEVLGKLADRDDCPRWVLDKLWNLGLQNGETAQLFKVARLNLQADPKNSAARARFINLCLLTGQEAKTTPAMAEALAKENPGDASIVTIQAFSLYLQGHGEEALALLEKLPEATRRSPRIALYYGAFAAAAGRAEEGAEYLRIGASAPQLAEEKAVGDFLRSACQAWELQKKGEQKGADEAWEKALAATRYRAADLETLAQLARKWGWPEKRDRAVLALATKGQCPAWAVEFLWPAALAGGDSAQIYSVALLLHGQDPKNTAASVNFVFASLLTSHETDDPRRLAETLHKQNPADPAAAAAAGLSVLQQGKPEEAVALLKTLSPAQLGTEPGAFYYGLFLAAAGQGEKVPATWPGDAARLRFPEEKTMAAFVQAALHARAAQQGGDQAASETAWTEAFTRAKTRPDWLEMLARMAMNWSWTERTGQALWTLASSEKCPRWAIDYLSSAAEKQGDTAKLYQVSKLRASADPKDLPARSRFIYLALLTGHDSDFPDRLADALHNEYPGDAGATTCYAFSLYRRGKLQDALLSMSRLKPEQLREPKASLFYGIILTAAGQNARAGEFLETGAAAARLPEEKALVEAVKAAPRLGAAR